MFFRGKTSVLPVWLIGFALILNARSFASSRTSEYAELQARLARGWNTFNVKSVICHVLMPDGFAVNVGFFKLPRLYLGSAIFQNNVILPGPRSYDGWYTELEIQVQTLRFRVQTAALGDTLLILTTPVSDLDTAASVVLSGEMLWNLSGEVTQTDQGFEADLGAKKIPVYGTDPHTPIATRMYKPFFAMKLGRPVGASTHTKRSLESIQAVLESRRQEILNRAAAYGELADVYNAMQRAVAWNLFYEPEKGRVITSVSRHWSMNYFNGYVLFCWDTYFAAYMAALDSRDVACINAVEMTRSLTRRGFVPNYEAAGGRMSWDRSQPPVGSMVVKEIYRRYGEKWLLEEVFDDLLSWNRWWEKNRNRGGLLCWGSSPKEPGDPDEGTSDQVNTWQGAAYESGLDNSPMFDGVPFNSETHLMEQADAGLMGLYTMDCEALADIADALGRGTESGELRERARAFRDSLRNLWSGEKGIFLNKRTDTGAFSQSLSPTLFYPLLGEAASQAQAERMVQEHLMNASEFRGDWVIPSISRNDPGYNNNYWRGRIWGPMNFLVYLGLRHYDLTQARSELVEKSKALLLADWLANGHVHENYNGDTGNGDDAQAGDRFYHWGALLGLMSFIEKGYFAPPEQPLPTGIKHELDGRPDRGFRLGNNYPNPFNPQTKFRFVLDRNQTILVEVFDVAGHRVRTAANGAYPAGAHEIEWNGLNDSDEPVSSGVYFVKTTCGREAQTVKVALIR